MTTAIQEDIYAITSLEQFKLEMAKQKTQFAKLMNLRSTLDENTKEIWHLKTELMKLECQKLGGKLTDKEETKRCSLNNRLKKAEEAKNIGKTIAMEWDRKLKRNEEKLNNFKQHWHEENQAYLLQTFNASQELSTLRAL